MKKTKQIKEYVTPQIRILKLNKSKKVFLVASGQTPEATLTNIEDW